MSFMIFSGAAGQKIGLSTIRPYAMNAMRRPSTALMMMGVISRYLACTPTNTRLSIARTAAATTVSGGCQCKASGTISPAVQTSSRMPRASQACRGNAAKDATPSLTLSSMKTFMTPDAVYRSAARSCKTHKRMFIAEDDTRAGRLDVLGSISPLMHKSSAVFRLGIVDVGAVTRGVDERLYRILRDGGGDELTVPAPLSCMAGHPDIRGEAPQHAEAALEVGPLLRIPRRRQRHQVASAHDVQHAVAVAHLERP